MKAKQTFLNLNPDRQKQILDTGFLEFTRYSYKNASLSSIIKTLGLAKGSFYRYFDSKINLYCYLINYAMNLRYNEIDELVITFPDRFEELLLENFRMKINFDIKYPLYSGFLYRILLEVNNPETNEMIKTIKKQLLAKTKQILQKYIASGNLKTLINVDASAFAVMQLQIGIYEHLSFKYNINYLKNIELGKPVFGLPTSKIMSEVAEFVKIISRGISLS